MAKKVRRKGIRNSKKAVRLVSPFSIYWEKQNYYLLILGFAIIIVGFYLMSIGPWDSESSLEISPILLIIGYVLVFPSSILFRKKDSENSLKEEKNDTSEG